MKAVDRSLSSYVECCIADADLKVKLNLEIIPRLSAAVIEGFKAVPRRGLEVGGLLLGTIENECVIVDEFVPADWSINSVRRMSCPKRINPASPPRSNGSRQKKTGLGSSAYIAAIPGRSSLPAPRIRP